MRLADLLPGVALPPGLAERAIASLAADSRAVEPGALFFAMQGSRTDGLAHAAQALGRGAAAVLYQEDTALPEGISGIGVPNIRLALAEAAARFYPAQPGTIIAVTGTSGKTSVTAFVRQIWAALGHQAASLGTLGVVAPSGPRYGSLTTPDPITLHDTVQRLAADGVTHLAVEASSHGLDQHRLDGLRLAAGGFTNLSHDHLDYHATMDVYREAKMRLFNALLRPGQAAVIDADADAASTVGVVAMARGLTVMTTGRAGQDIHLLAADPHRFETRLELVHRGRTFDLDLPLAGAFQVSNALLAAGLCIATGDDPVAVLAALPGLQGAPGRLDRAGTHGGAPVFVDYAHKPDALDKVLGTLRPYAPGRLVVVFGCGGDRDAAKRPLMGAIATRGADVVIVTDDNPRGEDPAAIRAAILAEAPGATEIADRRHAIEAAVGMLREGDVLVVAGKGHETGQIVGTTVLPFSDHDAIRTAIAEAGR